MEQEIDAVLSSSNEAFRNLILTNKANDFLQQIQKEEELKQQEKSEI